MGRHPIFSSLQATSLHLTQSLGARNPEHEANECPRFNLEQHAVKFKVARLDGCVSGSPIKRLGLKCFNWRALRHLLQPEATNCGGANLGQLVGVRDVGVSHQSLLSSLMITPKGDSPQSQSILVASTKFPLGLAQLPDVSHGADV